MSSFTIPTLLSKYQKHIWAAKAAKKYSWFANRYKIYLAQQGCFNGVTCIMENPDTDYYKLTQKIFPEAKPANNWKECMPEKAKRLNSNEILTGYSVLQFGIRSEQFHQRTFCLKDGTLIAAWGLSYTDLMPWGRTCNKPDGFCALYAVTTENKKHTAILGRNAFYFVVTGNGEIEAFSNDPSYCDTSNANGNGLSCLHRLMSNGWKMDY